MIDAEGWVCLESVKCEDCMCQALWDRVNSFSAGGGGGSEPG